MHILDYECRPYQNQKRWLLQNILAEFNFDIQFWFIMPGWERLANNSGILKNVIDEKGFVMPEREY